MNKYPVYRIPPDKAPGSAFPIPLQPRKAGVVTAYNIVRAQWKADQLYGAGTVFVTEKELTPEELKAWKKPTIAAA